MSGIIYKALVLSNEHLIVQIMPEEGGRITSLQSLATGIEFLTQSTNQHIHLKPGYDAQFQHGPCAGIEECLPTVGACDDRTAGGPVPDHGDFWQLSWRVTEQSEGRVSLSATGFSRPLLFRKTVILRGGGLAIRYSVQNIAEIDTSFLYACHPLFAIEAGDRIVLPSDIDTLQLTYSKTGRFGQTGDFLSWPGEELDTVLSKDADEAEMFYSRQTMKGRCGLYRTRHRQGLILSYPPRVLPYLGLWLCYGGWPGGQSPQQYAIAMEPTAAPCNTLKEALDRRLACLLLPGDHLDWELIFQPTSAGISWQKFQNLVEGEAH
ncbi:aldose epimerase family protein [Edaphobacter albus]|uniref:aldose epimerase family protein n=1 Tax=Edaphobacter sp. 4G125 TaxID=2763071 RepID=UPI0021068845|nr:aldose epimerase [Edaphobacter sp. 4G125]